MSSEPSKKEEYDAQARAYEEEYRETHPGGPYPPAEVKPKQTKSS